MNIILVGKLRGKPVRCQIGGRWAILGCTMAVFLTVSAIVAGGFYLGTTQGKLIQLADLEEKITEQRSLIHEARSTAQSDLDALASRIGLIQANMIRNNAAAQRVVKMSKIDAKEFDFDNEPPYGGPASSLNNTEMHLSSSVLDELDSRLMSQYEKLDLIQDILLSKQLQIEGKPTGRPINKGWISSYYGKRTDPFSGKLEMHKGMDFASKAGSEVLAVASGLVTWSGKRYGYGNLVEITHGNGYATRYGHNEKMLVEVGDTVKKGDPIALMGSTGRSTGPHVHFEVLLNDRQIDPLRFVQSKS